jgi:hypothetical protein
MGGIAGNPGAGSPVPVHPFEVKIIDIYLGPWDTWDIYARMFLLLLCINEIWEG